MLLEAMHGLLLDPFLSSYMHVHFMVTCCHICKFAAWCVYCYGEINTIKWMGGKDGQVEVKRDKLVWELLPSHMQNMHVPEVRW